MAETKVISIRLAMEDLSRLESLARENGISRNAIVASLVRRCRVEVKPVVVLDE